MKPKRVLMEEAIKAIDRVHCDQSAVPIRQTLENLKWLREYIGELVMAVSEDVRRSEKEGG